MEPTLSRYCPYTQDDICNHMFMFCRCIYIISPCLLDSYVCRTQQTKESLDTFFKVSTPDLLFRCLFIFQEFFVNICRDRLLSKHETHGESHSLYDYAKLGMNFLVFDVAMPFEKSLYPICVVLRINRFPIGYVPKVLRHASLIFNDHVIKMMQHVMICHRAWGSNTRQGQE